MPTAVPIDPAKLIAAAQEFANHHLGAGRPRPVWLRRAVSSAYYALFHSIGLQAAAHVLPTGTRPEQLQLCRSFGHRQLKEVCEWIAGRRGNPPSNVRGLIQSLAGTPIDGVAAAFCDLQEARHKADYDHLEPVSKAATLLAIADAERATQQLEAASERDRHAFFSLLVMRSQLR